MKKRNKEPLTPWAQYQKDHGSKQKKKKKPVKNAKKDSSKEQNLKPKKKYTKQAPPRNRTRMKQRQKFNHRKIRNSVIIAVTIIAFVTIYILTSISRVHSVKVTGNKRVDETTILKDANVHKNDFIIADWINSTGREKNIIRRNVDIKDANISVSPFGNLTINIKEDAVMGYVIRNKSYFTIKQNGTVAKKSSTQPNGDYPVFRGFKKNKILKKFLKEYAKLPNEVQNDVAEVDYSPTKNSPNRLHFFMNDGNQIYAILPTFAKKMKYYPAISASMKKRGIVDLQVGAYSHPNDWTDPTETDSESTVKEYKDEQKAATNKESKSSSSSTIKTSSSESSVVQSSSTSNLESDLE